MARARWKSTCNANILSLAQGIQQVNAPLVGALTNPASPTPLNSMNLFAPSTGGGGVTWASAMKL